MVGSDFVFHFALWSRGNRNGLQADQHTPWCLHVAAAAEAAHLACELGLNANTMVSVIESGPVGSPHTKRMIRPMLEGSPADSFGLAIGLREKDARYCLEMAHELGQNMTIGEDAHHRYVGASKTHGSDDDLLMLNTIASSNGKAPRQNADSRG